jgi:hypothetical protein
VIDETAMRVRLDLEALRRRLDEWKRRWFAAAATRSGRRGLVGFFASAPSRFPSLSKVADFQPKVASSKFMIYAPPTEFVSAAGKLVERRENSSDLGLPRQAQNFVAT